MSYAEAINAAMAHHVLELRQLGMLLAQAGMDLPVDLSDEDLEHVQSGYDEQLADFPNG